MTGIFYGSTTGSTEAVAQDIARLLGVAESDLHNVADTSADEADKYDLLLLGSPTWGCGELQDDWYSFLEDLKKRDLRGKQVALFGCGDSRLLPRHLLRRHRAALRRAAGMRMHLHRIVRTAGLCRDLVAGLLRGAVSRAGHRRKRPRKDRCAGCSVVSPTGIRTAMSTGKDFTSPTRPTDCTAEPYNTLSRLILPKESCASVPTHAKPGESRFPRPHKSYLLILSYPR